MDEFAVAAVFDGPGKPLELQRFAYPELTEGELLVEVTCLIFLVVASPPIVT